MSRRREAAELAHALALSTQQARDISDISPHSLSSENADRTQDSKELELRIVGMDPPTATASDEVAFFSSRNVDADVTHDDTIQSFSASHHDNSVIPNSSDPFYSGHPRDYGNIVSGQPFSPALAHLSATEQTSRYSSSRPKLSPTQTSDAQKRPVVTYQRKRDAERTPLRGRDTNKDFQLSSSPLPSDDDRITAEENLPNNPSSEHEIVEVIETNQARAGPASSSSRSRMHPEIVLSRKKRDSRQESPDPLDSFHVANQAQGSDNLATSSVPSSAGPSNSPSFAQDDGGRRSGRVKAAAEKKEAEQAERRRLRQEMKAREAKEEERLAALGDPSHPRRSPNTRDTPRKKTQEIGQDSHDSEVPTSASVTVATPAPAKRKTPVSKKVNQTAKKRSRVSNKDAVNTGAATEANDLSPVAGEEDASSVNVHSEIPAIADSVHHADADEISVVALDTDTETAPVSAGTVEEEQSEARVQFTPGPPEKSVADVLASRSTSLPRTASIRAATPLSPPARHSPGPQGPNGSSSRPGGIKWQTSRSDLNSVLSKFPGSRLTGMSKRHRIAPLHAKIGPPVKALPPAPLKPVKKKKGDSDDEDDEEEGNEGDSGDEEARKKKAKAKAMEWFMVED